MTPAELQQLRKAANIGLLNDLVGMRFSMSGRMSMKRDDMIGLIRACGGRWDERPLLGTHYLIVGDTSIYGRTAKIREAQENGVRVINETEFVNLITPQVPS